MIQYVQLNIYFKIQITITVTQIQNHKYQLIKQKSLKFRPIIKQTKMSRNLIINRLYSSKNNHQKQSINNQKNRCGKYQNYQLQESTGIKVQTKKHANFFNNYKNNTNNNQLLQQSLQSTPSEFEIPNPQNYFTFQKKNQKNFCKAFFDNFQANCQIVYSKVKIPTNSINQKSLQRKLENELINLVHKQSQLQLIQNRFSSSTTFISQNAINNDDSNFNANDRHTNNHYKNQNYQQQQSLICLSRQKKIRQLKHSGISLVQINNQMKSKNRLLYKDAYLNRNQSQIQLEYYKQESQTNRNYQHKNNQIYPYLKNQNNSNNNKDIQPNGNSLLLKNSNFNRYSVLDIRRKYEKQNERQQNSRRKIYQINNPIQYQYSKSHINFESKGYQSIKSEIKQKNQNQFKIANCDQQIRKRKTEKIFNQIQQGDPSFPSTRHFYFNQQLVKAKSLKTQPVNQESVKRAQHSRLAYYRRQRQLKLKQVNNSRSKNGVRILTQRSWQNTDIQNKNYDLKYQRLQLNQKKQKRNDSNLQNQFSQRYLIKSFQNYQQQNQNEHRILQQQQKQNKLIYVNKNRNSNLNVQSDKIANLRKDKYIQRESRQSQRLKSIHNQLNNIYHANKFHFPLKEVKPKLVIQQKRRLNQVTKEERPTLKKVGSIIRF